jgi:S-formylglutathione hydrolase FrmB
MKRVLAARLKPSPFIAVLFSVCTLALLAFVAPLARAQGRIDCSSVDSRILKRPVRYCVQVPGHYDQKDAQGRLRNFPVLYYLHGLGDDEQSFSRSGGWTLIEDLREHRKIGDFLIVAPGGDNSFYINSADGRVRYSDFFVREFVPYIEKKYRVVPGREGRAITGISMGGYGALRFAFAYPEMFSAVSAQSAALMLTSADDLNAASEARLPVMNALGPVFGNPLDVAHWRANDPLVLAKKNRAVLKSMGIYFNCGQSDDYGFEVGAAALDKQLSKEGIAHEYRPYPGRHSANYFLSHLEEVMEFHSREFGKSAVASRQSSGIVVGR